MKKETSAKTPSKPKGNEKKASAKKKADSYPIHLQSKVRK